MRDRVPDGSWHCRLRLPPVAGSPVRFIALLSILLAGAAGAAAPAPPPAAAGDQDPHGATDRTPSSAPTGSWRGFVPRWTVGTSWRLEVRPKVVRGAVGDRDRSEEPGPPEVLRFRVSEIDRGPDLETCLVDVRSEDAPPRLPRLEARLVFARGLDDAGRPVSLALARYQYIRRSQRGPVSEDVHPHLMGHDPFPVLTGDPAVPFDVPVLGTDFRGSGPDVEALRRFQATAEGPGIRYATPVLQRVRPAGRRLPWPGTLAGVRPDGSLEYLFIRGPEGSRSRQIWHPAHPWYLWAEGSSGEARLLLEGSGSHRPEDPR